MLLGYLLGKNGIAVIINVSPAQKRSVSFSGWHSCIGTVGGSPRKLIDRKRFEKGPEELVRVLQPHTILVYGSADYPCFDKLIDQGIKVIAYPSRTASAFDKRRRTR